MATESAQEEWNKAVNRSKLNVISELPEMIDSLLDYSNPKYVHVRGRLELYNLTDSDLVELREKLEAFLVGAGAPGEGFIAQVLAVNDKKELSAFVNKYTSLPPKEGIQSVDSAVKEAKCWMAEQVWLKLADALDQDGLKYLPAWIKCALANKAELDPK